VDPARHRRVKELFLSVCDLDAPERGAVLERECAGDDELRASVESMLAFDAEGADRLRGVTLAVDLAPGTVLDGRFELRERIGAGGLGDVWSAEQSEPVRRTVAIKVVKLGMDTRQVLARFETERRTLAILDHPHIAHVLDAGSTPSGRPYFAMELIAGIPITAFAERARLDVRERLALVLQLCHAVQYAHQKGIIHRDLKPSNVLVMRVDGVPFVKVIDFGIAKAMERDGEAGAFATIESQVFGTPAYMSPEQARNTRDVDTRTDVWALGVILHELLVGSTPFAPTVELDQTAVLAPLLDDSPTPRPSTQLTGTRVAPLVRRDEVEGDLDWIVLKALEKDRERRYPSAAALADDIERHLGHEPVVAGPPSRWYRVRKFVRRNRTGTAAVAIVFLALVAGITSTTIARNAEHAARVEAVASLAEADSAGEFLGDLLSAANPLEKGRDVRVLDVLEDTDGAIRKRFAEHPRAEIRVRRILGSTLRELGELDEALLHQRRALELGRETYPPGHTELLSTMLSLGAIYDEMGRYSDSEPIHRELLELFPKAHGPNARPTLGARCNFGLWLYDQERYAEAEEILRPTLAAMQAHLDPNHHYLLNCMQALGTTLLALDRSAEAEELFHEVMRRGDANEPGRSPQASQSAMNLALAAFYRKDYPRALQLCDEAKERVSVAYGADHWRVGRVEEQRADVLRALGRIDEARASLENAQTIYAEVFGPEHPWSVALVEKRDALGVDALR
jgi:non-specific serine/threonine protein kinase/serine/threonine-protein kinase